MSHAGKMVEFFRIDGHMYDRNVLSQRGAELLSSLEYCEQSLQDLRNHRAILSRSKQTYIDQLSTEIVESRSGFDVSALFLDD